MSAALKDLKVWQESVALAGDILRAIRQNSRRETKMFTDAMMQTATDIAGLIAQAHHNPDQLRQSESYRTAKSLLLRLETELAIAKHADVIPAGVQMVAVDHCQLLHRLLAGYLVYLDRQLKEDT